MLLLNDSMWESDNLRRRHFQEVDQLTQEFDMRVHALAREASGLAAQIRPILYNRETSERHNRNCARRFQASERCLERS